MPTAIFDEAKAGVIANLDDRLCWQLSEIESFKRAVEMTRQKIADTKQTTADFGC